MLQVTTQKLVAKALKTGNVTSRLAKACNIGLLRGKCYKKMASYRHKYPWGVCRKGANMSTLGAAAHRQAPPGSAKQRRTCQLRKPGDETDAVAQGQKKRGRRSVVAYHITVRQPLIDFANPIP